MVKSVLYWKVYCMEDMTSFFLKSIFSGVVMINNIKETLEEPKISAKWRIYWRYKEKDEANMKFQLVLLHSTERPQKIYGFAMKKLPEGREEKSRIKMCRHIAEHKRLPCMMDSSKNCFCGYWAGLNMEEKNCLICT